MVSVPKALATWGIVNASRWLMRIGRDERRARILTYPDFEAVEGPTIPDCYFAGPVGGYPMGAGYSAGPGWGICFTGIQIDAENRMKAKIISSFLKGEQVPEWLAEWTPGQPGAEPGSLTFACDCHVVETSDGYTIVHDKFDEKFTLRCDGAKRMVLSSPARPLRMSTAWSTLYPEGDPRAPDTRVRIEW